MYPFGPRTALIGHTGFVGSNLAAQYGYLECFNSRNISAIAGQEYDMVVCAGVNAVKYLANKDPAGDWAGIQRLLNPLATVRTRRFVLISTVDVYASPWQVIEADPPSTQNHAYGKHRALVEEFVRERFPQTHIIRLPALFGPGLKKNIIFDLLNRNCLESIQPASSYQYYDVKHLTADVCKVIEHELPLLNLATAPLTTQKIMDRFCPAEETGGNAGPPGHYDFRSLHAGYWGRTDEYLYGEEQVMEDLEEFFGAARRVVK